MPVYGIVAVGKPVQEGICAVGGIVFRQRLDTLRVQRIRSPLLPIRSLELEVVSDTHELYPFYSELSFEPAPIVTGLDIIILIIDSTDNVYGRKPRTLLPLICAVHPAPTSAALGKVVIVRYIIFHHPLQELNPKANVGGFVLVHSYSFWTNSFW